ncbi:hypothetical protein GCM10023237_26920 [Streptomyces coeruleoprunus]
MDGEPHRQQAQLPVLGEVVADDGEVTGVPRVDVDDTVSGGRSGNGAIGARDSAKLLNTHREAPDFLGGQALDRDRYSRPGADVCVAIGRREHMPANPPKPQFSCTFHPCE